MIAAGLVHATLVAVVEEHDGARTLKSVADPIDILLPEERDVVLATALGRYRIPELVE